MKLAARMTLAIAFCALLLFGGGGLLQLRAEEHDLRRVVEREALLLGRSLQSAFDAALRDRQIQDVLDTLAALFRVDPSVAVFVFDEHGKLVGTSRGAAPSDDTRRAEAFVRRRVDPVVEFEPHDTPELLRVGLRLHGDSPSSTRTLVLEKPLTELQRDLEATRLGIAVTTALFVLTAAGLTWFLTRRYVALPLGTMVANMKRVRDGDLRITPDAKANDEVGATQEEFERLVSALDAARARADQEFEARRRVERALQDADKLITLGQLSAVMAHEIGSPLQILEGRARALRKHADDADATRRTADLLVEQAERISRIVAQLLSTTRRRPPAPTSVDVEASVRRVAALLELEARRRDVRFSIERTGRTDALADADQVQQVALNVMRNALEASPRGSAVRVLVGGDDDSLLLDVRDSGPGITDGVRTHLFEPFFTTKADAGGSGLGLSVVKSIVQEHGGNVQFVDDGAPGCLVRVRLPRRAEARTS